MKAKPPKQAGVIRVCIADDHAIIREGLSQILGTVDDIICVQTFQSGHEVLEEATNADWDVLILDLGLPGGGEATLQRLQVIRPSLPVIIFSMHPEDQYAIQLLQSGASAYLSKGRPSKEILEAIRTVSRGGKYVTQELAMQLLNTKKTAEQAPHQILSPREKQVFMLLIDGKQPSDIVKELHVSPSTVSTHIHRIKQKLQVESVVEMVKYAYRSGILE